MPIFEYKALDSSGELVQGVIDADDPREARSRLRRRGTYPTELWQEGAASAVSREVDLSRIWQRISKREIAVFTRQLATLLEAGLPLVDSLTSLVEQIEDKTLKKVVAEVRERVREGSSLSDALSKYPKSFSSLYVNMVRAGEGSGALEKILRRLADYAEDEVRLRSRLRAALSYPLFMVIIGLGVLFFLFSFVIPMVTRIFTEMERALPLPTMALIATSDFLKSFWWAVLLGIGGLFLGVKWLLSRDYGRLIFDRLKLRMPLVGSLFRDMAVARFSRTLGTLVGSEAPILSSLNIVKDVVGNSVFSHAIEVARDEVGEGENIANPLGRSRIFPPIVIRMVSVGEESGNLEGMLLKVAETYDDEIQTRVTALTSLLEPLIILTMGLVVGFVVLAVLLPIFEMNQIIR
ncbi:type II secretion system inner membrane protein GspF [candidate division NPL-UPA2 bacterium]|nr:type II secretion system inner membrane protein GspF [candidate division NPL-UPA2 bacterium]